MAKPPYIRAYKNRHGRIVWQFRRKGYPTTVLPGPPGAPGFEVAYEAAMRGKAVERPAIGRRPQGTIAALIASYIASPDFRELSDQTRRHRMVFFNRIRDKHGHRLIAQMRRKHAVAILDDEEIATTAQQRHRLLLVMRRLFRHAIKIEYIEVDPTASLEAKPPKTEGFAQWTNDHVTRFRAHFLSGTMPRLAMELALCTGQRRSDVVRMGWQHVKNGCIVIRQQKTGTTVTIPIQPELWTELEKLPRDRLTFLVTEHGQSFSVAGFGNWFRVRCLDAGLEKVRMHGLRKAKGRMLAEAGATASEITAILGHSTIGESEVYVRAANRTKLAASGQAKLAKLNSKRDK